MSKMKMYCTGEICGYKLLRKGEQAVCMYSGICARQGKREEPEEVFCAANTLLNESLQAIAACRATLEEFAGVLKEVASLSLVWEPKPGERILVRQHGDLEWRTRVFIEMESGKYVCRSETPPTKAGSWQEARPISDEEGPDLEKYTLIRDEWVPRPGEDILVKDRDGQTEVKREFLAEVAGQFVCRANYGSTHSCWLQAKPLEDKDEGA